MAEFREQPGVFVERLHPGYWQALAISGEPLVCERSDFQLIEIFDTHQNGRVLALDKVVQITSRDEAAYSEMLAHVPILEHGNVRNVLIIGGGDGCIAEDVLKHQAVETCEMAEIDPRVVELCREHFRALNAKAFADRRFKIHIADAAEFLKRPEVAGRYDIIIGDRPDPLGPAGVLFADGFYASVSRALTPKGIAVFQTGTPFYQPDELLKDQRILRATFRHAGVMLTVVPTYVGGYIALSWASNGHILGSEESIGQAAQRFEQSGLATDHYTPAIHKAAFALPISLQRLLATAG